MHLTRLGVALLLPLGLGAQEPTTKPARIPASFDFSIANIMRGPELYGRAPSNVRWSADSRWIVFRWNEPGTDWREPMLNEEVELRRPLPAVIEAVPSRTPST